MRSLLIDWGGEHDVVRIAGRIAELADVIASTSSDVPPCCQGKNYHNDPSGLAVLLTYLSTGGMSEP